MSRPVADAIREREEAKRPIEPEEPPKRTRKPKAEPPKDDDGPAEG